MLTVTCPVCGASGDETDFHAGGQAHVRRSATHDPVNVTDEQQRDYLFIRHNPKGLHFERWRCDRGCGKWFNAARDTVTLPVILVASCAAALSRRRELLPIAAGILLLGERIPGHRPLYSTFH